MKMMRPLSFYTQLDAKMVGLELLLGQGIALEARIVWVKRKGGNVLFERGEYGIDTLDEVLGHIEKGTPVALVMGGRGVIHRIVEDKGSERQLLKTILPNADSDDMYVQSFDTGARTVVSVARRKLVDDIVNRLRNGGAVLRHVGLGPFAISIFREYLLENETDYTRIGRHCFSFDENHIKEYELLEFDQASGVRSVDIAGEQLNELLVPAFSTAFHVVSGLPFAQLPIESVMSQGANDRRALAFRKTAIVMMGFFFLLLGANAYILMHYKSMANELANQDARTLKQEIEALKMQANANDELLDGLGRQDVLQAGIAVLGDRIVSSMPEGVLLDKLALYPRDETLSRKNRRPVHAHSTIRIDGTCEDMQQLNAWLGQLRTLEFCKRVAIAGYGHDERAGVGVFSLDLITQP